MAEVRINDALNLVIPAVSQNGNVSIWAYHTPIAREVFESNYRILSESRAYLEKDWRNNLANGRLIAGLVLREKAQENGQDAAALLTEIRRLTVILAPTDKGYETLPADVAIARNIIDAEEWREVESAIVFFTFQYWLTAKAARADWINATSSLLTGFITFSTPTEYAASLQQSTPATASETLATSSATSFPT